MYDRTGQCRDIACLAADLLVVAGLRLRGPERGRGLPHRYQRGVRGDADDTVGAAGWWPWHRGHLTVRRGRLRERRALPGEGPLRLAAVVAAEERSR